MEWTKADRRAAWKAVCLAAGSAVRSVDPMVVCSVVQKAEYSAVEKVAKKVDL